jgi:hypothetical protein
VRARQRHLFSQRHEPIAMQYLPRCGRCSSMEAPFSWTLSSFPIGEEPLRPRAGRGVGMVPGQPARTDPEQHAQLVAKMRGHYAYYGITGNTRRLSWYATKVARIWRKWLSRRGSRFPWDRFNDLLKRHPLPAARIVHRYTAASEALP